MENYNHVSEPQNDANEKDEISNESGTPNDLSIQSGYDETKNKNEFIQSKSVNENSALEEIIETDDVNKPKTLRKRPQNITATPRDLQTKISSTKNDNSKTPTVLSPTEKLATPTSETSEKLLPVMNVTSSVAPFSSKKERTFSIDRTYSVESENSKSPSEHSKTFSSQESLQSPKHTSKIIRRASKNSSISSSRESLSSNARRLSGESTSSVAPKQTSTSLRRQSLTKSSPLLKTITQKKLLSSMSKKPEKSINTELANLKYIEPKVDTNRKQISRAKTQLVASVTQRLYAKANKKDSGTGTDSLSNPPRSELPKELAICNNARLRLKELTQRALKAHKYKNVETQTELFPVLRVKEVSTDCFGLKKDLGEVKDAAVLNTHETSDATVECSLLNNFVTKSLENILLLTRSCGVQTTDDKNPISFKRYLTETSSGSPIIAESLNINISHNYINGARNGSLSDDSLDNAPHGVNFPTPDLISNHNSLEQHAQSLESESRNKLKFAVNNTIQNCLEDIALRLRPEEIGVPIKNTYNNKTNRIDRFQMVCAHAPQIIMTDIFKEKCKPLARFAFPDLVSPRLVEYKELTYCEPLIITQPVMERTIFRTTPESTYSMLQESSVEEDQFSDLADSVEFVMSNRRKVQFHEENKNKKLFQAMTEFVSEATTLMKNLTKTATNIDQALHRNCLEDCELQVSINNVSGLENFKRKKSFTNGTQTDDPKHESCCSQTSEEISDFLTPINKYETLLEDSCKRLEHKINSKRCPRARQVSVVSQDSDDDFISQSFSRGNSFSRRYNPWDLSTFEIEDSSLESNPVTFSDYGSLPRKTHKRQRTPTCSPSAFLKQLTNMRKQVIETSKEELFRNNDRSHHVGE